EDEAHEGEEGDRQQRVVAHDAEDALRQRLQQVGREEAELDADEAEEQPVGGERERHGVADQQHEDERQEHDRRHVRDEELGHRQTPASVSAWALGGGSAASSRIPSKVATRLMISETPCRISSAKPIGISTLTGQRSRPPASPDIS